MAAFNLCRARYFFVLPLSIVNTPRHEPVGEGQEVEDGLDIPLLAHGCTVLHSTPEPPRNHGRYVPG